LTIASVLFLFVVDGEACAAARPTSVLKDHAMINVFVWLLFGGLAGWMASRLTRTTHDGVPLLQIIAGGLGALVGGVVFLIFDTTPLNVFSVRGLAVALIGAMIVIGVTHMLVRRPI
jgi:uncharacterized membrane protein YeaQ/YmgE (transglycosylase-associated protein family)